ncbi:hypothetical protein GCM10027079_06040 [Sediminivirga luteola]|uniref:Uncharacterized protein n=2 Tax=Sediminivirga luteola TaxID=1774748 RepID=A0A8J2TXS3_9MICO|nr:hypothetical protein GCM10011333_15020 [Sediminivirga luteola]
MWRRWRRQRTMKKVQPGTGKPLRPFRWWRALLGTRFHLDLPQPAGEAPAQYAVDVNYFAEEYRADLYLDGRHHAGSTLPAAFPVPGGVIEVAASAYGLKRMHYIGDDGESQQLQPHPRTTEGMRARFGRRFPRASRLIGAAAIVVLLVSLTVGIPQLVQFVTGFDAVAQYTGTFTSPINLPGWANTAVTAAAVLAAFERAITLRNHWLIDMETGWFE